MASDHIRRVDAAGLAGAGRINLPLFGSQEEHDAPSIGWVRTPPGDGSPAGLHKHDFDQVFFVLSGTMNVLIDGDTHTVGADTLVYFPAGVEHRNWNAGDEPTLHLAINMATTKP